MKKTIFMLVAIMFIAGIASAQISKPFSVYAGGGLGLVQGEYSDMFKTGYHGLAAVGFSAAPMIQFLAKVEYHNFETDLTSSVPDYNNSFKNMMFGGGARISPSIPSFPLKVFGMAGGGLANIQGPDAVTYNLATGTYEAVETESQNEFYFEIGAGAEMTVAPSIALFGMVRYVSISSEGESFNYIPLTVGVKF